MNLKVELEQAAKSVPAQGQGFWRIEILFPETATDLLLRATQGDELAARMLSMLFQAINDMAKKKPPALCLLCDHVFRNKNHPPTAFVLLLAAVDRSPGIDRQSPYAMPAPSKPDRTRRAKAQGKHEPRSAGPRD